MVEVHGGRRVRDVVVHRRCVFHLATAVDKPPEKLNDPSKGGKKRGGKDWYSKVECLVCLTLYFFTTFKKNGQLSVLA